MARNLGGAGEEGGPGGAGTREESEPLRAGGGGGGGGGSGSPPPLPPRLPPDSRKPSKGAGVVPETQARVPQAEEAASALASLQDDYMSRTV